MNLPDETSEDALVAAVKHYMQLLEQDSAPPPEQYARQQGQLAEELLPALEGLLMVHRAEPRQDNALAACPDTEFTAKPIGDFQIIRELGRGGMGVVYEAVQLSLGRRVALKVLPFASGLDEVRLQRFQNEAHAAAALHHTNIVPVYAVGSDRGVHYYAMQLIEGQTLAEIIERIRQPGISKEPGVLSRATSAKPSAKNAGSTLSMPMSTMLSGSIAERTRVNRWIVSLIRDAAMALEHAHRYGVIHRDIKPSNLMLDSAGKIWLADFGLAQIESESLHLTRSGDPIGTLRYMSPEQATGNRTILDHRADIYSLGITLYELLTLQPAFNGTGFHQLLDQVVNLEPPPPKSVDPSLPIELDTIVRKAIAKSPDERYATSQALADDLQSFLDDKPIAARPPTFLERAAKWRRRNNGLVAAASLVLFVICLCLLFTTLLVWREQHRTRLALASETQHRQQAERAFGQARAAVDAFSRLSESELAYRPDLYNLRRSFLETSLEFYDVFLQEHGDNPVLAADLEATSKRVESMVSELNALDNIGPYMLLTDNYVQTELSLSDDQRRILEAGVFEFQARQSDLWDQDAGHMALPSEAMNNLLRGFQVFVSNQLTAAQVQRLQEIDRQWHLPFTFKTKEIIDSLGLTKEQQVAINQIIIETRPKMPVRRPREAFPPPPDDFFLPPGPPPPRGGDGPPFRGPRRRPMFLSDVTKNTVESIRKILTPEQRQTWDRLIGEPFTW